VILRVSPVKKRHGARDPLDAPWHPKASAVVEQQVAGVEERLGLVKDTLYEACRYPNRWQNGGRPSRFIRAPEAGPVVNAVAEFLAVCRGHLFDGM